MTLANVHFKMFFLRDTSSFWEKTVFSVSAIMGPLDLSLTIFNVSVSLAVSRMFFFSAFLQYFFFGVNKQIALLVQPFQIFFTVSYIGTF